jgi:hypothetical protein
MFCTRIFLTMTIDYKFTRKINDIRRSDVLIELILSKAVAISCIYCLHENNGTIELLFSARTHDNDEVD